MNSQSALETALNHRSIRKFTEQAISEELFAQLIQAGQMASTSSFLQNVSVIRVRDRAIRAQIRAIRVEQGIIMWKIAQNFWYFALTVHAINITLLMLNWIGLNA